MLLRLSVRNDIVICRRHDIYIYIFIRRSITLDTRQRTLVTNRPIYIVRGGHTINFLFHCTFKITFPLTYFSYFFIFTWTRKWGRDFLSNDDSQRSELPRYVSSKKEIGPYSLGSSGGIQFETDKKRHRQEQERKKQRQREMNERSKVVIRQGRHAEKKGLEAGLDVSWSGLLRDHMV